MFKNDVFLLHLFTCMGTMMELSTCFFSFPGYRSKGALPSYWLMPFAWALQTQETLHTWYRHYIISHCSIYLSFKRIMNKIRLVQGSFSCQNVYCQHRSVNTTPCPEPHGSSVTQSVFSLKFAGKVSSVKYSFLTVSTEQNLTFRKKQITEINNSMQKAGATIAPNTATAAEPFHLN